MNLPSHYTLLIRLMIISLPLSIVFSCKKNDSAPPTAPAVTTTPLTNITTSSATTGGTILTNGNAAITQSGIVWSKTNVTPTLTDSVIKGTTSSGSFTTNLTGLDFNTAYYIRAFATNSVGTGYGDVIKLNTVNDTSKVRFTYNGNEVIYSIVISPTTGKKWLDRNLGAKRVAASMDDYQAYGDLFQWGRPADGHQLVNWTSATTGTALAGKTTVLATSDTPGHNNIIITANDPYDWRTDNNRNRWNTLPQGPCPAGWHIPTTTEWAAEVSKTRTGGTATTGGITDHNSAYSQLKLTITGFNYGWDNVIYWEQTGRNGIYWSSSDKVAVGGSTMALGQDFGQDFAQPSAYSKAQALCVRCIMNIP